MSDKSEDNKPKRKLISSDSSCTGPSKKKIKHSENTARTHFFKFSDPIVVADPKTVALEPVKCSIQLDEKGLWFVPKQPGPEQDVLGSSSGSSVEGPPQIGCVVHSCKETFVTKAEMLKHLGCHSISKREPIKCSMQLDKKGFWFIPKSTSEGNPDGTELIKIDDRPAEASEVEDAPKIVCVLHRCEETFKTHSSMLEHLGCHSINKLEPLKCSIKLDEKGFWFVGKSPTSEGNMDDTGSSKVEDTQKIECVLRQCKESFDTQTAMLQHLVSHSILTQAPTESSTTSKANVSDIACAYKNCDETFTTHTDMLQHVADHASGKTEPVNSPKKQGSWFFPKLPTLGENTNTEWKSINDPAELSKPKGRPTKCLYPHCKQICNTREDMLKHIACHSTDRPPKKTAKHSLPSFTTTSAAVEMSLTVKKFFENQKNVQPASSSIPNVPYVLPQELVGLKLQGPPKKQCQKVPESLFQEQSDQELPQQVHTEDPFEIEQLRLQVEDLVTEINDKVIEEEVKGKHTPERKDVLERIGEMIEDIWIKVFEKIPKERIEKQRELLEGAVQVLQEIYTWVYEAMPVVPEESKSHITEKHVRFGPSNVLQFGADQPPAAIVKVPEISSRPSCLKSSPARKGTSMEIPVLHESEPSKDEGSHKEVQLLSQPEPGPLQQHNVKTESLSKQGSSDYEIRQPVIFCALQTCRKYFHSYPDMHTHFRSHGTVHICSECWKAFKSREYYNLHQITHMDYKPYQCTFELCERRFFENADLKEHALLHTTDLPYVCPYVRCGEAFSNKYDLADHVLFHIGT